MLRGLPPPQHYKILTLKLAGYFATHIQAGGGGGWSLNPPPKIFETVKARFPYNRWDRQNR